MISESISETKARETGHVTPKCLLRWTIDPATGKLVARWTVDEPQKTPTFVLKPAA
jgi:hypothetical protein